MTDDFMSSVKFWTKPNGEPMVYGDKADTPVPRRTYRCKATCGIRSEHNNTIIRKHPCKLTTDHADDHRCICGRTWAPELENA